MADILSVARSELILGGQRSGKSRRAELIARAWMSKDPANQSVMIATAQAWDDEMRERISRHQADRIERVPGMRTVEEPIDPGEALARHTAPRTLVVIDCLTLWLTNLLMPAPIQAEAAGVQAGHMVDTQTARLLLAIQNATGPVVLVGNEIGLGVIPLGRETRHFVDALGRLNQQVAATSSRVTLMAAGLPLTLKDI
ncbi:MAG: bifunctional adenosylcobinamide kinase/adenosylcobinamide-phosphate guanylyltransferase [Pseudomonadota bacterium]